MMIRKPKRPCEYCGKECAAHQRNVDGSYLHDGCAAQVTREYGWNTPGHLLASRPRTKEEGQSDL